MLYQQHAFVILNLWQTSAREGRNAVKKLLDIALCCQDCAVRGAVGTGLYNLLVIQCLMLGSSWDAVMHAYGMYIVVIFFQNNDSRTSI